MKIVKAAKKIEAPTEQKNETSREKFLRLAPPRVESAVKRVKLVGNLVGSGTYESTPNEVNQIIDALESAVAEVKQRASKSKGKGGASFSFRTK